MKKILTAVGLATVLVFSAAPAAQAHTYHHARHHLHYWHPHYYGGFADPYPVYNSYYDYEPYYYDQPYYGYGELWRAIFWRSTVLWSRVRLRNGLSSRPPLALMRMTRASPKVDLPMR